MKSFQETLGRLQWITSQSRPEMRFAALECSLRTANTQVQDILVLNKAIKKLKKRAFKLKFPHVSQMNDITNLKMYAFSDAAVFNLPGKVASTRGHIILLVIDEKAYDFKGMHYTDT